MTPDEVKRLASRLANDSFDAGCEERSEPCSPLT